MKILAIPASNSRKSINRQLLRHAASVLQEETVELLDINDCLLYTSDAADE